MDIVADVYRVRQSGENLRVSAAFLSLKSEINQRGAAMPRGGARPGSGRKPGVRNKSDQRLLDALEAAQGELQAQREAAAAPPPPAPAPAGVVRLSDRTVERDIAVRFRGDAHAVLVAVYQSEDLSLDVRLDAAKAAIPYEKPRLSAVAVKVDDRQGFLPLWDWMEQHPDGLGEIAEDPGAMH